MITMNAFQYNKTKGMISRVENKATEYLINNLKNGMTRSRIREASYFLSNR